MKELLFSHPGIRASRDVASLLEPDQKLVSQIPDRLRPLASYLEQGIQNVIEDMRQRGSDVFIAGPDWCRDNAIIAGSYHSEVILQTYGDTYALPNKDPRVNTAALNSGGLDMYLLFNDGKPVGTACMVDEHGGIAELGRAASLGRVGNRIIQDMRILGWLTDEETFQKFHTLFATCRTAPDRDIGNGQVMKGGQAVSRMWEKMPEVVVAGFGPLYKKHGALEQFAYAFITKEEMQVKGNLWVNSPNDYDLITSWLGQYGLDSAQVSLMQDRIGEVEDFQFNIAYPPKEIGITELVHGEIELGGGDLRIDEAIQELSETGVPFMQIKLPVDRDTIDIQKFLSERKFQAFQFTPGLANQSPALWFGKINGDVSVVPTFWQDQPNPFWQGGLALHSSRIANGWEK